MKSNDITLKQFKMQFLEYVKSHGCTDATLQSYERNIARLLEYAPIADATLSDISPPIIAAFTQYALVHKQVSRGTLNRYLSVLRIVLRYAHKLGLIATEPDIRTLKCQPRQPYFFTEEECRKWLDCCTEPLRSVSVLAIQTGMRVSEILALKKDSVSLFDQPDDTGAYGKIEVRAAARKARYCRRTLPANRELRDTLRTLISDSQCQHVFTSPNNPTKPLPSRSVSRQVADARSKGGFAKGASLHALRATFIRKMLEFSDPYTVARIIGHSPITTTMKFAPFHRHRGSVAKLLECTGTRSTNGFVRDARSASQLQQVIRKLWVTFRTWGANMRARAKKNVEYSQPPLVLEGQESNN
jgi:site-specific recombinase XerD